MTSTLPTRLRAAAPTSTVRAAVASTKVISDLGNSSRILLTTTTEFASPGLYTIPTRLACGTTCLMSSICLSSDRLSETPVTLLPLGSRVETNWAATGSVTAEYTTGMVLVAATTAWADGVAMATMTSGLSPTNLRAICAAIAVLPCAVWNSQSRPLESVYPASFNAFLTPSLSESRAGCSTMDVTATDCAKAADCANAPSTATAPNASLADLQNFM